jgi:hypothetical protein
LKKPLYHSFRRDGKSTSVPVLNCSFKIIQFQRKITIRSSRITATAILISSTISNSTVVGNEKKKQKKNQTRKKNVDETLSGKTKKLSRPCHPE